MKKERTIHLDFVIDKLTNSIQNTISSDSFPTEVSHLTRTDLKQVTKKKGWNFNWKEELNNNNREVYKLTITNNPTIVQGLLSFTIKETSKNRNDGMMEEWKNGIQPNIPTFHYSNWSCKQVIRGALLSQTIFT